MNRIVFYTIFISLLSFGNLLAQSNCEDCGEDFNPGPAGPDGVQNGTGIAILLPQMNSVSLESVSGLGVAFNLNADSINSAGDEFIIDQKNCDIWINYSCIAQGPQNQKSISVESSSVPSISGLTLSVCASAHVGTGGGNVGSATPLVVPSSSPADIITNIGTSFTGSGNSNGHKLTYHLTFTGDFSDLNVDDANSTIIMTYTISD